MMFIKAHSNDTAPGSDNHSADRARVVDASDNVVADHLNVVVVIVVANVTYVADALAALKYGIEATSIIQVSTMQRQPSCRIGIQSLEKPGAFIIGNI